MADPIDAGGPDALRNCDAGKLMAMKLMTMKMNFILRRAKAFTLASLLAMVVGPHANAQQNLTAKQARPGGSTFSASVVSRVELNHLGSGTWCYGSEPAYIFQDDRKLKRADIKGDVSVLLEVPEYFNSEACSEDGQTISFFTQPNVREPTLRLTVVDVPSGKKAEYLMSPPKLNGLYFNPRGRSMMSPDGTVFALPSQPVLVSGPDLLKDRRIIHTDTDDVFWTHQFIFVREGEGNRYRIQRLFDLHDIGTIDLPADRIVRTIVECQGSYFARYFIDKLQQDVLEPITDARLGGKRAIVLKDIGSISQSGDGCAVALTRVVSGVEEVGAVELLGRNPLGRIDLSALGHPGPLEHLAYRFQLSKDGKFLLGSQMLGPIGNFRQSRIVALRIER
jgi:hypothetical protein